MKRVLVAAALAALACGKSEEARRRELDRCSAVHTAAELIALCLVTEHGWKDDEAQAAGQSRQRELDSLRALREDSAWNVLAPKRQAEVRACQRQPAEVADCLLDYGWPKRRATRAADSVWRAAGPQHQREIQACVRRERTRNIAGCLRLYYKWPPDRALAANDSVRRAALK